MPAPANADELLDLVRKSGVVEEQRLRAYLKKLGETSSIPKEPAKLAGILVRDAILTYFQAEQLLQGKYKRFTIGKYKVLEKLGSGGMGQVFLCEHKLMRRRVAVKVLPTAKAEDPSSLGRFYREARAVAAVDHPNIVRAYDIDQDENLHFLVMEYVDGTNLQDLVKKAGPLETVRACHYVYASSVGLQHAHEIGLIHRDVKPGNILVDRSGVVKILDMGLARFFNDDDDMLTKKYDENVLGTADYLAPEQALDSHTVDIRADIYSLGATFYYLLTGTAPFPEGSVAQKLIWHQNRQPRPVRALRSDVPDEVIAVVERMMMKDPAKRYQLPSEVMAALAPWVATPIPPPADREIPNVSPAAGGTRAPATMVSPAGGKGGFRHNGNDSPTVIASGGAPIVTPPPLNPFGTSTTPGPVVWETLEAETQSLARGDTDRPGERPIRPTREASRPGGKRLWIFAAAGVALVTLLAAIYLIFIKGSKPIEESGGTSSTSRRITVSRVAGDNSVPTLRDALTKAAPGDTIVIVEPRLTEPMLRLDRFKHKDLTIESATPDGKPAVIEAAAGTHGVMMDALNVEGVRLKNIEFDGRGLSEVGLQMSGNLPGWVIEGVTVRGVKTAGFKLHNVAGEPSRQMLLDRCRVLLTKPAQTGVWILAAGADTKRVTIRNLRVEGVGSGVGFRLDGASSDLEITGSRFFSLDSAGWFGKPPHNTIVKGKIVANSVFQSKAGLVFDLTPPAPPPAPKEPAPGKFELLVERNYFANTPEIAKGYLGAKPIAGVKYTDNAHGPATGQGNFPVTVWTLNSPLIPNPPDPANDATFLRFPGGQPEIGANKVKVGAP